MPKLVIDNSQLAEEFFADVRLFGIQCPHEPHWLIWIINNQFLYDFRYQAGSEIEVKKKGRPFRYPIYQCMEPNLEVIHLIYANQYDGEYLLPELRHYDFIWLIKGELPNNEIPHLIFTELKAIPQVQLVTELTPEKIINKTQLVL